MLAVHFGAGNIGRGFIGSLLSASGYEVCFVDINKELVNKIREHQKYKVILADQEQHEQTVQNVRALNSKDEPQKVIDAIAQADLVTTAVGPHVLKAISPIISEGIFKRMNDRGQPLNIIAGENMIGASKALKEYVKASIPDHQKNHFEQMVGFPNAAVDRIVPEQNQAGLDVAVEPFYEWVVEKSDVIGHYPPVKGITYVTDLAPFIERKLFTVNTGHAMTAYLGYQYGQSTIKEAIDDPGILEVVRGALTESGKLLVKKYDFDQGEHQAYVDKIIHRFQNPNISDEVTRVGRAPIRKLGENERLIGPAKQLLYYDISSENLCRGIAAALKYDYPEDPEAVELQQAIAEAGVESALKKYSGLDLDSSLVNNIKKFI